MFEIQTYGYIFLAVFALIVGFFLYFMSMIYREAGNRWLQEHLLKKQKKSKING